MHVRYELREKRKGDYKEGTPFFLCAFICLLVCFFPYIWSKVNLINKFTIFVVFFLKLKTIKDQQKEVMDF